MSLLKQSMLFSRLVKKAQDAGVQGLNAGPAVQDKNPAFYLNQLQSAVAYFKANPGHTFDATTKNYLTNLNAKVISPLKLMKLDPDNSGKLNSMTQELSSFLSKEEKSYFDSLSSSTSVGDGGNDGVMTMPADEIKSRSPVMKMPADTIKSTPQINVKQTSEQIAFAKSVVQQIAGEVAKPTTTPEKKGSLLGKLYVYRIAPLLNVYNKLMAMKTPEKPVLNSSYERLIKELEEFINSTKQALGTDNFQFLAQVDRNTLPKFAQVVNHTNSDVLNTIKKKCINISNALYYLIDANNANRNNLGLKEIAKVMANVQDLFNVTVNLQTACHNALPMIKGLDFFLSRGNSGTGYEPQLDLKLNGGKSVSMMIGELYQMCLKYQA